MSTSATVTYPQLRSKTTVEEGPALLFERWQRERDELAREALVERFLPLARALARRYARGREPVDDLVQVASLGLVKAIDRFDHTRGKRFESFAVPTILGELRRYFRDASWAVHVPRGAQERALEVKDAAEQLASKAGRSPSVHDIALYLELDDEQVLDALQAGQAHSTVSLDAPAGGEGDDVSPRGETIGSEDERYELVEDSAVVAQAFARLAPREQRILQLRFSGEMTQTEIAGEIGLSQMHVSRLLRRALERMRELADPDGQQPAAE